MWDMIFSSFKLRSSIACFEEKAKPKLVTLSVALGTCLPFIMS